MTIRFPILLAVFLFSLPALGRPTQTISLKIANPLDPDEAGEVQIYLNPLLDKPFDEHTVKRVYDRLDQLERYKTISCSRDQPNEISCSVIRTPVIRQILVKNLPYSLLEKDFRKRLSFQIGEAFDVSIPDTLLQIKKQKTSLKTHLERQGYFDTEIKIQQLWVPGAPTLDLVITIVGGSFARVGKITIKNDSEVSTDKIRAAFDGMCFNVKDFFFGLEIGTFSCYSKEKEHLTTNKILSYLDAKGYWQATARVESRFNTCKNSRVTGITNCVDLRVSINKGPKVVNEFILEKSQVLDLNGAGLFFRKVFGVEFFSRAFNSSLVGDRWPADETILLSEVREAVTFSTARQVNQKEISDSIVNIKSVLAARGYSNAEVTVERVIDNNDLILLRFHISPGDPHRLNEIIFVGNTAFSHEALKDKAKLALSPRDALSSGHIKPKIMDEDANRVEAVYKNAGYPNAQVSASAEYFASNQAKIHFYINAGKPSLIKEVRFNNDIPDVTKSALLVLSNCQNYTPSQTAPLCKGSPFFPDLIRQDENRINEIYSANGYLGAKASSTHTVDPDGAIILFSLAPTPLIQATVGGVLLNGNNNTRRDVILREIGANITTIDAPLLPEKIDLGISKLRQRSLFSRVSYQFLNDGDNSQVFTWISLVEKNTLTVDTSILFSTDKLLALEASLLETNLFGAMFQINTQLFLGLFWGRETSFENNFRWPAIWGTPLDFELTAPFLLYEDRVNRDPQDRHFKAEASAGFRWYASPRLAPYLKYTYRLDFWQDSYVPLNFFQDPVMSFSTVDGLALVLQEPFSTRGILQPGVGYNSVDNPFNPKNGLRTNVYLQLSGSILGGQIPFAVVGGQLSNYVSFGPFTLATQVVALRALIAQADRNWWVLKYQSDIDTLGGDTSVRGYQEGSIGVLGPIINDRGMVDPSKPFKIHPGNFSVQANLELRFPILRKLVFGDLDGALITDVGFVDICTGFFDCQTFNGTWRDIQHDRRLGIGVGAGLRYVLPVGPLALDFAVSPVHQGAGLFGMESRIHLLFGYPF